jgi:hypothetical protein
MRQEISRASMSQQERDLRSSAKKLLDGAGLIHGYLSTRYQVCGTPNCRCTRGEKHQAFVLVIRREGKTVQIPIPRRLVPTVQRWVEQEKTLQEHVRMISELQTERIREMKRAKPQE